jgi:hypothetical protein
MANSKLLKEAIADAKAVRETAIANAKIALEEAFTPRLQSILSKKLQAEMEDMDDEEVVEDLGSSEVGAGDNEEPAAVADETSTELGAGTEEETAAVGAEDENFDDVSEEDEMEMDSEEEMTEEEEMGEEPMGDDEDELDLEAIIRELESELEEEEDENQDGVIDDPTGATMEEEDEKSAEIAELKARLAELEGDDEMDSEEPAMEGEDMAMDFDSEEEVSEEEDETIDLDEILREMGYGDDEEEVTEEEEGEDEMQVVQTELNNAYSTIQELRKTINEVNLLNAKLLYANKLFRGYNLTNEQKVKIVENLDRTSSVREVKLVYATLAESMKFTGTERKVAASKKTMTEGLASRTTASTAPKKEIIAESNDIANRFKELAGIVKK